MNEFASKVWRATLFCIGGVLLLLATRTFASETVYFWIGERSPYFYDGYVLPLREPEQIAAARQQLELSPGDRLNVYARIVPGADGINRNLIDPGRRRWSWHVVELLAFFQAGTPIMTAGCPSCIDKDVELWMAGHEGKIGFLGYKVFQELTREDIFAASIRVVPEGLDVYWLDLGTNYTYTVEMAEPPDLSLWRPAFGSWPIAATNWIDITPAVFFRVYRVRAQQLPP